MKQALSLLFFLLAAMSGILLHGFGHWLAARAVGMRMARLIRTRTGFRLLTDGNFPSYDAELYCALGGPLANVLSALLCRLILVPFGIASAFTSVFIPLSLYLGLLNLLPLHGFDGARVAHCLLCCQHRRLPSLSPEAAGRIVSVLSGGILVILWLLSLYLLLRRGSALSLYVFCWQLFRSVALDGQQNRSISEHSGEIPRTWEYPREYFK